MGRRNPYERGGSRSWDPVAAWYTGWVGEHGSEFHRESVVPAVLDLLQPQRKQRVLEIGCGPGVLAPSIAAAGARYTGVDASRRMIGYARRYHGTSGEFIVGDATALDQVAGFGAGGFDAVVFMLSIQDIDPLERAIAQAAWCLRSGGCAVLVLTHPCFRVPRQSGWGWDEQRRLQFRRVDRYLTPLSVPMKRFGPDGRHATRSHHRPLQCYLNALGSNGLLIEQVREIPTHRSPPAGPRARAARRAGEEIPLFLGIRAVNAHVR